MKYNNHIYNSYLSILSKYYIIVINFDKCIYYLISNKYLKSKRKYINIKYILLHKKTPISI